MMFAELTDSEIKRLWRKIWRGRLRAQRTAGGRAALSPGGYYTGTVQDCQQALNDLREEINKR